MDILRFLAAEAVRLTGSEKMERLGSCRLLGGPKGANHKIRRISLICAQALRHTQAQAQAHTGGPSSADKARAEAKSTRRNGSVSLARSIGFLIDT